MSEVKPSKAATFAVQCVEYDGQPWEHTDGWVRDQKRRIQTFEENEAHNIADEYRTRNPKGRYIVVEMKS